MTARPNYFLTERVAFHCESAVQALATTSPVAATGLITCVSNANMADSDFITIGDGFAVPVIYEYDKSANGVTSGRVNWAAGAGTAAQTAGTLKTAIEANQKAFTVTDNLDGTLTLAHKWLGAGGNVTITENVANAGFLVAGMSGGANAAFAATVAATTTQKFGGKFPRTFRVDDVEWLTATTVTGDATDYWDIELKNGTTSVAKWSTLTTAQSTITGGTGISLVLSATDANLVYALGDTMSLVFTKHGSPAALPPGRLTVQGRYVG